MPLVVGGLRLTWKVPVEGKCCGGGAAAKLPPLEGGTTISARFEKIEPGEYHEGAKFVIHTFG